VYGIIVVEEAPLVTVPSGYNDRQHALRTIIKVTLQFLSLFLMIVFMILDVGMYSAYDVSIILIH
jgi:hypothetical protein